MFFRFSWGLDLMLDNKGSHFRRWVQRNGRPQPNNELGQCWSRGLCVTRLKFSWGWFGSTLMPEADDAHRILSNVSCTVQLIRPDLNEKMLSNKSPQRRWGEVGGVSNFHFIWIAQQKVALLCRFWDLVLNLLPWCSLGRSCWNLNLKLCGWGGASPLSNHRTSCCKNTPGR